MATTVREGFEALKKLMDEGHGDLILMCSDGQGNVEEGGICNTVDEVDGTEQGGEILDMEIGTKYVSLYMG